MKLSTGLANSILTTNDFRKLMRGMVLRLYSGSAPSTANAATTGTMLVEFRGATGSAAKQKHQLAFTAVNATTYTITIDGYTISYTSSGAATRTEIATAFRDALNGATGQNAGVDLAVTASLTGVAPNEDLYIEADTAGIPFDISESDSNITLTTVTSNAYTLEFDSSPASGVISKSSSQTWSGVAAATGTAGYFRIMHNDAGTDDGTLSTTALRIQGTVSTSQADLNLNTTSITSGGTSTLDSFTVTLPLAAS